MPGSGSNDLNGSGVYYDQEEECSVEGTYYYYWLTWLDTVGGAIEGDATPGTGFASAGDCYGSNPGGIAKVYESTQETFSGGVDLGYLNSENPEYNFGINLSAQDGWATDAELIYTMGSAGDPYCGKGAYPNQPGSEAVVVHS
jgi:hypothetical protein